MKKITLLILTTLSLRVWSQEAFADIRLKPANSFKVKSTDVKGFATQKGDIVEAKNIIVGLKNIDTGIGLRDKHTKNYLEVEKYPEAVLVSAKGQGGKGEGIARIHGVEKPISGTYKINGDKLTAEFPIKLSDFGIKEIKYMVVSVVDDAKITVTVPIKK
jgi:polyisoprenoid-binding protein YceI